VPFNEKMERSSPVIFRVTDIGLGEATSVADHFVMP